MRLWKEFPRLIKCEIMIHKVSGTACGEGGSAVFPLFNGSAFMGHLSFGYQVLGNILKGEIQGGSSTLL